MGSGDMSADELLRFFVGFNKAMVAHLGAGAVIYEVIDWRSLHSLLDATRDILGPLANMAVWAKDRPGQGSFLRSQHELILRSEEHTSELQSLMRISYAVFCLKKKTTNVHR